MPLSRDLAFACTNIVFVRGVSSTVILSEHLTGKRKFSTFARFDIGWNASVRGNPEKAKKTCSLSPKYDSPNLSQCADKLAPFLSYKAKRQSFNFGGIPDATREENMFERLAGRGCLSYQ